MKKTTYAVLLVVLALGLSACKGKEGGAAESPSQTGAVQESTVQGDGAQDGAQGDAAPGGSQTKPGQGGTDQSQSGAVNGEVPGEGSGTGGENSVAGQEPSDGTASSQETDPLLAKIHDDVKAAYGEQYIPSASFDAQMMEDLFGVTGDLYDSYVAEGPMISAHVDTFVGVRAREGKGGEVEALLISYREMLLEDTMQYPSNLSKIQASQVVRHGDYVFFVMLGSPDPDAEEQGEEAALDSAKANNQIAIDVIDKALD